MTFGQRIRQLRMARNMEQNELADAVHITSARLSNYELDKRYPQYPIVKAIADALNVDVSELYDEDVRPAENTRDQRLKELTAAFDYLSEKGQQALIERAKELAYVPKYKNKVPVSKK